jgi:HPt (histidine-containing phosphotransfer) domain-containing protein
MMELRSFVAKCGDLPVARPGVSYCWKHEHIAASFRIAAAGLLLATQGFPLMASSLPIEVDGVDTSGQVLDLQQLLGRCLGNLALAERCLVRFEQKLRADLEEVERAVDSQDYAALTQVAHRVKGSAATVSAISLANAAAALEDFARARDAADATAIIAQFRKEVTRFLQSIPRFRQAGPVVG